MEKKILFLLIFLFLFLLVMTAILQNSNKEKRNKVCFKNHCFSVELAVTPQERSKGLMFRESLGEKEGMLFVYEKKGEYSFWMKNTLIPLDIIWMNEEKEVVFISENNEPCKEDPCSSIKTPERAKYVLEIKGGFSKEIGLTVGDKLEISL
ncbi:MAG: DUF192 domain-containing protein [bacterium]